MNPQTPPTILIIEDEPAMRLLVRDYLEFLGYHVLEAPDGTTAIEVAAEHPFVLAFVDINLPDINGVEVMKRLRANGVKAPLVVMSGNLRESYAEHIQPLNVAEVLEKPVDLFHLEHVIKKILGDGIVPQNH